MDGGPIMLNCAGPQRVHTCARGGSLEINGGKSCHIEAMKATSTTDQYRNQQHSVITAHGIEACLQNTRSACTTRPSHLSCPRCCLRGPNGFEPGILCLQIRSKIHVLQVLMRDEKKTQHAAATRIYLLINCLSSCQLTPPRHALASSLLS